MTEGWNWDKCKPAKSYSTPEGVVTCDNSTITKRYRVSHIPPRRVLSLVTGLGSEGAGVWRHIPPRRVLSLVTRYFHGMAVPSKSYSTPEGVVTCDRIDMNRPAKLNRSYSTPEGVVTCDATLVDCLPTRSSALNSRGSG